MSTEHSAVGRLTNVVFDHDTNLIFAGDDKGLIYRIAPDLSSFERSAATSHGVGIHALVVDADYVYTRDNAGNLVRWSKHLLSPSDFIVSEHMTDGLYEDGATAVPSPSNALALVSNGVLDGNVDYLVASNAYGTLAVFDRKTFAFRYEIAATIGAFPEKINAEIPGSLIVSDVRGTLYQGSLTDSQFQPTYSTNAGAVHSIVFDHQFDRYWCSCDYAGNIFFLNRAGKKTGELQLTNDDVEEIVIDQKNEKVYVGCFDHYVHVLKNAEQPVEIGAIGPFKFQINRLTMTNSGDLLVMLESGELYLVNPVTGKILNQIGGTTAIWNMFLDNERLVTASEHGNIEIFKLNTRRHSLIFEHVQSIKCETTSRLRQIKLVDKDTFIAGTTNGDVFRINSAGTIVWRHSTGGIIRDVAYDADSERVAAVNEIGEVWLLDANNGKVLNRRKFGKPIWCANFDQDNHLVIGERALPSSRDTAEPSLLYFIDKNSFEIVQRLERSGNHKRIRCLDNIQSHRILVNGNGSIGVQIIDTQTFEVQKYFTDWLINTPENAVIHENRVYVITYGYQLLTYDLDSGETLDVQYVTEGYPKALELFRSPEGKAFLLVGGRNFLMSFLISEDGPQLVSTHYLYDLNTHQSADQTSTVKLTAPTHLREKTLLIKEASEYV